MKIPRLRLVAAIGSLAILPGCDSLYGIQRWARVQDAPSFDCVESAIRSVEGIDEVRHEAEEGGRPLTFSGLQKPDELHYFHYRSGELQASLLISIDYAGEVSYSQGLCRVNRPIPREQIDAVRPLMLGIERALEEQCGFPRLSETASEWTR